MTLVVEEGDGDDLTANSFADLEFIRAYNLARGRTLSTDDEDLEPLAIKAMDYIATKEPLMLGQRTFGYDQPLCYPRQNVSLYGTELDNNVIPVELQNAQAELVFQVSNGVDLQPTTSGQPVKRRKIGPIEREFFGPEMGLTMLQVDQWLDVLLAGGGSGLPVLRV